MTGDYYTSVIQNPTPYPKSWAHMIEEFHKGCGTDDPMEPTIPPKEKVDLRWNLTTEEYEELKEEMYEVDDAGNIICEKDKVDIAKVAKELCDLIYVAIGTGLAYGIDMDAAFKEVHRSNMTKLVDGKVMKRADGKILKPPTYEPADMSIIYGVKHEKVPGDTFSDGGGI